VEEGFMENFYAVLIDVASIQEYIFSSNKLKENVGASYLVENIFKEELKTALAKTLSLCKKDIDLDSWKRNPNIHPILNGEKYEIGYIGGGNALLLFKKDIIKNFIKEFTVLLIQNTPGLRTNFGTIGDFDFNNFKDSMERLNSSLKVNKNSYFPITTMPKHGITADCPLSGESAEFLYEGQFVSGVSFAKIGETESSRERITEIFREIPNGKYAFTNDIEELVSKNQIRHEIAVVHIDGNGMGARIKSCRTLNELRTLSICMGDSVIKALQFALKELIKIIESGKVKDASIVLNEGENGCTILPIRPIVIGGDDVTFVCDARLAFFITEKFIEQYSSQSFGDSSFSTSAGICIVKLKYPFFKAYKFAEELCEESKKKARKHPGHSYIDFLISLGGETGEIDEIRERHFFTPLGVLNFGPYLYDTEDASRDDHTLMDLKKCIKHFRDKFTRAKLMQLRDVILSSSAEECEAFAKELCQKGLSLFKVSGELYYDTIWHSQETPYYEALELLDFYPAEILEVSDDPQD